MAKKTEEKVNAVLQFAVGRRKRAIARVRMYSGKGSITINSKSITDFARSETEAKEFMRPIVAAGMAEDHDFSVKVIGGGSAGQLEAARHGIARSIAKINEDLKKTMRDGGFLTRDPREKERKKIYHVRARKSPQFSKR